MGSKPTLRYRIKLIEKYLPLFREALHEPEKRRARIMNPQNDEYPGANRLERDGYKFHEGNPEEQAAEGRRQVENDLRKWFLYEYENFERRNRYGDVNHQLILDEEEEQEYFERSGAACDRFVADLWEMASKGG